MSDEVTQFPSRPGNVSETKNDEGYLSSVIDFLVEEEIFDGEITEDMVDLDPPTSDELVLGHLTSLEKKCFILSQMLGQIVREEMVEVEAKGTDQIAAIQREQKVSMPEAATIFMQTAEVSEEIRNLLFICNVTFANLNTMYEWGVRARFNQWSGSLIVRKGFQVCHYG